VRATVTVEDLLRMRSGIDAHEGGSALDPVARMLFAERDMAAYAAGRPLKDAPGVRWEYSSANTLILARLLGQTVGGGAAGMRAFVERELAQPLGITSLTMEFDGAGTFIGSTFVYATARDYARLGQLYLDDGLAPDGTRILPEGWVAMSRSSTLGAGYGAGFWTNDGGSPEARARISAGFAADGFYASGVFGQRIYIVPSARLVVARFGNSAPPDFGIKDDLALLAASASRRAP
jgi:CubicO group peptidase (beta-lactamase class C family)